MFTCPTCGSVLLTDNFCPDCGYLTFFRPRKSREDRKEKERLGCCGVIILFYLLYVVYVVIQSIIASIHFR